MSWGAGRGRAPPPGAQAHQRAQYVLRYARPLKPATVLFALGSALRIRTAR
jgi:hypothetical protein